MTGRSTTRRPSTLRTTLLASAAAIVVLAGSAEAQDGAASRPAYRRDPDAPRGTLAATVLYEGEAPASRPIELSEGFRRRAPEDAALCDACAKKGAFFDESLLVDRETKGVKKVAVALREPPTGRRAPLPRATLDNFGAAFRPRLLFAPVGEPVVLKNSDPIQHATALATLDGVVLCNTATPPNEERASPTLLNPGVYVATCPLHDWMRATIVATRHPYVAATDAFGRATFDDAPIGAQTVVFWHETLGVATRKVEILEDRVATIELRSTDFKARR
jgi:hypothetical protein